MLCRCAASSRSVAPSAAAAPERVTIGASSRPNAGRRRHASVLSAPTLSRRRIGRRHASTSTSAAGNSPSTAFYRNALIEQYASKKPFALSLRQLVFFGRKSTPERIIESGNFVRSELPIRLAHRIRALQDLPFAVAEQPWLTDVRAMYSDAFERIRRFPELKTLEDNDRFVAMMSDLMREHLVVIPKLALAMAETSAYLTPAEVDDFMTRMFRSRVARRIMTEQHIALTAQFRARKQSADRRSIGYGYSQRERHVGIVDAMLSPGAVVQSCADLLHDVAQDFRFLVNEDGTSPPVIVDVCQTDTIPYITDQLEYMVFELLKNSIRATMERWGAEAVDHPIVATVVVGEDLIIRISDEGGGIPPVVPLPAQQHARRLAVFSFAASHGAMREPGQPKLAGMSKVPRMGGTVREQLVAEASEAPGFDRRLGIGLPLARIYAEIFGGSLDLYSLVGQGTDAFLRLPKLGQRQEKMQ